MNLSEFIKLHNIRAEIEPTWSAGVYGTGSPDPTMNHYKVVLKFGRRQMTTPFRTGCGLKRSDWGVYDVLECLASDARGYENARNLEDWRNDYSGGNRKEDAKIYAKVGKQTAALKRFMGEHYEALLCCYDYGEVDE